MPDLDIDMSDAGRERVIDYVRQKYGHDKVSQIITFGTMKAKLALKDVARAMEIPVAEANRIAKMIPNDPKMTLEKALEINELRNEIDRNPQSKRLFEMARKIEGLKRHTGIHAAGVLITKEAVSEYVPLARGSREAITTQFEGEPCSNLGLLKMDFLGLRTLTVIDNAEKMIRARHDPHFDINKIPLDDKKTYDLLSACKTLGIFQLESGGMRDLIKKLQPSKFSDVSALVALYRPGPMESGMMDMFVRRKNGQEKIVYETPLLEETLKDTYGCMVYQEQIMQISMVMSGFSAGKADKLRKAMGKKKIDVMRQLQEDWNQGAVENGFSLEIAKKIWEDAEKFAKYAFNKSHSAAYAILVMRTAYLKAHYPNDYMAAVLSSYMGNSDRLIKYIASCNRSGIPVLSPDVNSSNLEFTPLDDGIRFGLAGIRGVGEKVAQVIIDEREKNGPYTSLHDFVNRVDSSAYNRKTLEALIKSGGFDSTGYTRKQLMYFVDETPLLESAAKRQKDKDAGQMDMFSMFADVDDSFKEDIPEPDGIEWDRRTKLAFEKDILKMYVSDHPLRPYENYLSRTMKYTLGDLMDREESIKSATFAGMVSETNIRRTKRGTLMASFTLEDTTGHIECVCFDYEKNQAAIQEDAIITCKGKFEVSDRGNQILVYEAKPLELSEAEMNVAPMQLELTLATNELNSVATDKLLRILKAHPGKDPVILYVNEHCGKRMRAELPLTTDSNSAHLKAHLADLFGRPVWKAS